MSQEYTEDKRIILKPLSGRKRLLEAFLLIVIVFAAYLLLSLFSFDPADPSWSQTATGGSVHNYGGSFGAWIADTLLFVFGILAYVVPLMLVILVWFSVRQRYMAQKTDFFMLSIRLIGTVALIAASCGLASFNSDDIYSFASGGVIGSLLNNAVQPWLHSTGATLALLCLWAIGVTLFTGWSWLTIAEKTGAMVLGTLAWVTNLVRGEQSVDNRPPVDFVAQSTANPQSDIDPLFGVQITGTESIGVKTTGTEAIGVNTTGVESPVTLPTLTVDEPTNQPITAYKINLPQDQPSLPFVDEEEDRQPRLNLAALSIDETVLEEDVAKQQLIEEDSAEDPLLRFTQPARGQDLDVEEWQMATRMTFASDQDEIRQTSGFKEEEDFFAGFTVTDVNEAQPGVPPRVAYPDKSDAEKDDAEKIYQEEGNRTQKHSPLAQQEAAIPEKYPQQVASFAAQSALTAQEQRVDEQSQIDNQSLIHPFLMRQETQLTRPGTPLPTLDLLTVAPTTEQHVNIDELNQTARLLEERLADYRVKAQVVEISPGPVVTRFELLLAPGVKAARISSLSRDLARSLSTVAVRVVEVIPGKPYVGLELPNQYRQTVYLREVLDCAQFNDAVSPLAMVLGKDIAGQPVVADLAKMPHLLVAGTTGSGKSVGVNTMILSILYKATPEQVKFIMIDPKMLELSVYEGIPHLLTEVVTDMKDAANALRWCVNEMERRYKRMSALGVRNIIGYNERIDQAEAMGHPVPDPFWKPGDSMDKEIPTLQKLPYVVVIVDEFADLIMVVGKKVEELIARLAQKARAAGIHLILATQRPSVDVITGLIKANIPTRIAFTVSSKIDSRTILDQGGAESLLGMGDMLYLPPNSSLPMRVHGAFVRDHEVHAVVQDWKARGQPEYISDITSASTDSEGVGDSESDDSLDPLFDQVVAFVIEKRRASISGVQRQFRIGYNRAARIIEQMEAQGIVSAPGQNGNRELLAPASRDY